MRMNPLFIMLTITQGVSTTRIVTCYLTFIRINLRPWQNLDSVFQSSWNIFALSNELRQTEADQLRQKIRRLLSFGLYEEANELSFAHPQTNRNESFKTIYTETKSVNFYVGRKSLRLRFVERFINWPTLFRSKDFRTNGQIDLDKLAVWCRQILQKNFGTYKTCIISLPSKKEVLFNARGLIADLGKDIDTRRRVLKDKFTSFLRKIISAESKSNFIFSKKAKTLLSFGQLNLVGRLSLKPSSAIPRRPDWSKPTLLLILANLLVIHLMKIIGKR